MAWYIITWFHQVHETQYSSTSIMLELEYLVLQIFLRAHWYYVHMKYPKNKQTNNLRLNIGQ